MHCCTGTASFMDCRQLLLHGEDRREWYWWERWFCGQTRRSIRENMRSMLWSNLACTVIDLGALIVTLATEQNLHEGDVWDGVEVALALPLFILHIRWTHHGQTSALKRIIPWVLAITVAYGLGFLGDMLDVFYASWRKTVPRLVAAIFGYGSLLMWANLLYFDFLFAYSQGALIGPQGGDQEQGMLNGAEEPA